MTLHGLGFRQAIQRAALTCDDPRPPDLGSTWIYRSNEYCAV